MRKDWEVKKLGDVATYINGYAFKPNQWSDTGIPIIRIQNLNDDDAQYNYCNNDNIPSKYLVNNGDILISWSASLGVYEWLKNTAYLNQHIFKVVFDKLEISKYYFKYAVSSKIDHMVRNAHGATMKHIVKKDFDNTKIYYPPLQTQGQIVEELNCLTSIIEKQKKQLNELDNLAQSIFYDMFGDPIENEKGWNVKKLGDICKTSSGGTPPKSVKEYFSGNILWLRSGEIKDMYLYDTEIKISDSALNNSNAKIFPVNTVVIAMYGATVGQVGIIKNEMATNQAVCGIFINDKVLSEIYLYYNLKEHRNVFLSAAIGGGQPNISQSIIRNTFITLPPLSLQQEFASKIEAIEKQKELIKKSIKETEDLFNSRMDYYFN
ncbi:restriction endonuclease subunit S [Caecibacteroides pullorum]|uniref:Restriction endonuclease subunit S n=1 Tax=Caecibacteroides pullorum TaxID=2725562 RepID=A0AA40ZTH2_9BACT|nr:restriction endonuclease subunit S [Caecibacteroides pullorum]MBM6857618.1 restriction endonuclease subunit S [Caecibacteroides pullorum]MBV8058737.1 restriction endonuclease subunit S [Caecibacteroides pullorum]